MNLALMVLVLALATVSAAEAQPNVQPASTKALALVQINTSLADGQPWANLRTGLLCIPRGHLEWNVGVDRFNVRGLERPARAAFVAEGLNLVRNPDDPFSRNKERDLEIAGTLKAMSGEICSYGTNRRTVAGSKGALVMSMTWKIYSIAERRVIKVIDTEGSGSADKFSAGGLDTILVQAITQNVKALAASADFKAVMSGPEPDAPDTAPAMPASMARAAILLQGSLAAKPMKIADAVGSVVLIQTSEGHGSGFLVSSDGQLMTAAHVVGPDKYVKIRWSDGLEGVGEVIRKDRKRDVALVKTDPRGRQPLALNRTEPQPGDPVFAIGAPLELNLQSTVTKGVVSANRIKDGFSFIQSDVGINHGDSGGPLLDEKGQVLGIADQGELVGDVVPLGINFFVPIGDALLFLKAEPR